MSLTVNSGRMFSLCWCLKKMMDDDPKPLWPVVPSPTDHLSINKIKSSLMPCTVFYIPRFSKLLCNSGLGAQLRESGKMKVAFCNSSFWWSPGQLFRGIEIYILEFLICEEKGFCWSKLPTYLILHPMRIRGACMCSLVWLERTNWQNQ